MRMGYKILYHPHVKEKDIPRIDTSVRKRIRWAIEERLLSEPEKYSDPLRKTLKGYRKLRVGDYRVVLRIEGNSVFILGIYHRRDVYTRAESRIR